MNRQLVEKMIVEYQTGPMNMGSIAVKYGFERTAIYAAARRYKLTGWKRRKFNRMQRQRAIAIPQDVALLGYIAGLVDGEGHIGRYNINDKYPMWRVQITNTFRPVLEWLSQILEGGAIYQVVAPRGRKWCGVWQVLPQIDILVFLKAIRPWLRIKSDVADKAISELTQRMADAKINVAEYQGQEAHKELRESLA